MKDLKRFINMYPLSIFFTLVFAISWVVIFLMAGPSGFPVSEEQAVSLGMAILLGPSIAGIFMATSVFDFRNLISRLTKWRVDLRWYLMALFTAPLATILSLFLLSFYSSDFQPAIFFSDDKIGLLIMALVAGLTVGLFEELGWTGFAVPAMLKRHNFVFTGIIVGLIWGLWHFPLFWQMDSFATGLGLSLLLARLFSWLPPYRVLMVRLYQQSESLLLVILMHLSLVATLLIFDPVIKGILLLIFILVRALAFWGIVLFFAKFNNKETNL